MINTTDQAYSQQNPLTKALVKTGGDSYKFVQQKTNKKKCSVYTYLNILNFISGILKIISKYEAELKLDWKSLFDYTIFIKEAFIEVFMKKYMIDYVKDIIFFKSDDDNGVVFGFIQELKKFTYELIDY